MLPYSLDVWFSVLARMNTDLAPWAVLAWAIAACLGVLTVWPQHRLPRGGRGGSRIVAAALGIGWLACGIVFFGTYLAPMFFGAGHLQALYVTQGVALIATAATVSLPMRRPAGGTGWLGRMVMLYALIVIPLVDNWLGGELAAVRVPGLAPEATVVFTAGWLLTRAPHPVLTALACLPAVAAGFTAYSAVALQWPPDWIPAVLGALPLLIFIVEACYRRWF